MDDKLREYLITYASKNISDGDIPSNPMVAFEMGVYDGKVELARLLLSKFGGPNVD